MATVQSADPDPQIHGVQLPDGSAHKRKLADEASPHDADISGTLASEGEFKPRLVEAGQAAVDGMPISESKRRAQNRAAQRAFRERKERHLRELESRIAELESESRSWKSTNLALRSQLTMLEEELQHYRPQNQNPSQFVPQGGQQQPQPQSQQALPAHMVQQFVQPPAIPQQQQQPQPQQYLGQNQQPSPGSVSIPGLSYDSPGSGSGSSVPSRADEFCDKLSMACGTRDRPVPEGAPRIASETAGWQQDALFGINNFGNNTADWVQTDGWNAYTTTTTTPSAAKSPMGNMRQKPTSSAQEPAQSLQKQNQHQQLSIPAASNDTQKQNALNLDFGNIAPGFGSFNLNSLGDNNNDDGLGFPTDINGLLNNDFGVFDPLDDMLVWDPQSKPDAQAQQQLPSQQSRSSQQMSLNNTTANTSMPQLRGNLPQDPSTGNELADEQVPVASQKFIPCADVWDRICSHPRFGEIDINSMCQELRNKARCSKTGVVLDEQDVDAVLGSLR